MKKNNNFWTIINTIFKIPNKNFWELHIFYVSILSIFFIIVSLNTFNKQVDTNGDNVYYYIFAKSLVQGDGYSNLLSKEKPKVSTFPPGYPLIMSTVMFFTDSVIAQKVLNSILLFIILLLFYFLLFYFTKNKIISSIISILLLTNDVIISFNTKMMSETSFILFSLFAFWCLLKLKNKNNIKDIVKDFYFIALIITSSYAYHIRFQGITLFLAIITFLMIYKRWKHTLLYSTLFSITLLPWIIRNNINNLQSAGYFNSIMSKNIWRHEEGYLNLLEVINRMFETINMIISKAIPDTIIPNYTINYTEKSQNISEIIIGYIVVPIIIYGLIKLFKKFSWVVLIYIVLNVGMISLWSAPSQNRYIVCLIPFLISGFFYGIVEIFNFIISKYFNYKIKNLIAISIIILSSGIISKDLGARTKTEKKIIKYVFTNYIKIAKILKKEYPNGNINIACRKPSIFYIHSGCYCTRYPYTDDSKKMISSLYKNKIDFIIINSIYHTAKYVVKAQNKYPNILKLVSKTETKPFCFFIKFDKKEAKKLILSKNF